MNWYNKFLKIYWINSIKIVKQKETDNNLIGHIKVKYTNQIEKSDLKVILMSIIIKKLIKLDLELLLQKIFKKKKEICILYHIGY